MQSKNTAYMARLDHLRFFAAFMVAIYHYHRAKMPGPSLNPVMDFIWNGETGVSLFMVLSGFILAHIALGKDIDYRKFIYNRFIRIYPLYLTAVFLVSFSGGRGIDLSGFIQFISPFANLGALIGSTTFAHLWTISVEFQFYLIFPFLLTFTNRYGSKYLIGLIGFAIGARCVMFFLVGQNHILDTVYSTLVGRIDQFMIGMLAAVLYQYKRALLSSPIVLIASLVAFYGWLVLLEQVTDGGFYGSKSSGNPIWIIALTIEAFLWAIFALAYLEQRWTLPRPLDAVFSYLGRISFSTYIWHFPVLAVIGTITPFKAWYANYFLIAYPIVIAASSLSYFIIERPFFAYRTKYVKGSGGNAHSAAADRTHAI